MKRIDELNVLRGSRSYRGAQGRCAETRGRLEEQSGAESATCQSGTAKLKAMSDLPSAFRSLRRFVRLVENTHPYCVQS